VGRPLSPGGVSIPQVKGATLGSPYTGAWEGETLWVKTSRSS